MRRRRRSSTTATAGPSDYVLPTPSGRCATPARAPTGSSRRTSSGVVAAAFTHWDSPGRRPPAARPCGRLEPGPVRFRRQVADPRQSRACSRPARAVGHAPRRPVRPISPRPSAVGWDGRARRHSDPAPLGDHRRTETADGRVLAARRGRSRAARTGSSPSSIAAHGRQPTGVEMIKLRQQATLATRPDKTHRSLAEMTDTWRQRAGGHIDGDPAAWVASLRDRNDLPLLHAADLAERMLADAASRRRRLGRRAARHLLPGEPARRSPPHPARRPLRHPDRARRRRRTHRRSRHRPVFAAHPAAPASHPVPLYPPGRVVAAAPQEPPTSTPPRSSSTPKPGSSTPAAHSAAPTIAAATVAAVADQSLPGRDDQAVRSTRRSPSSRSPPLADGSTCSSGPPAPARSTTMAGLRAAWETEHGPGSVLGLAPSAAAAEVLADEIGIDTENTAKWLTEWRRIPSAHRRTRPPRPPAGPTPLSRPPSPRSALRHRVDEVARRHRPPAPAARPARHRRRSHPGRHLRPRRAGQPPPARRRSEDSPRRRLGAAVRRRRRRRLPLVAHDRGDTVPQLTDVRRFSCRLGEAGQHRATDRPRASHRRLPGARPRRRGRAGPAP